MELFKKLLDYGEYLKEYPFHQNLGVSLEEYDALEKKINKKIKKGNNINRYSQ